MENKQLVVKELEDLINSSLESKFDGDILRTYDLKYAEGFDNSLLTGAYERVYITQLDYSIVPTTYACKIETTYLGYLDISEYSGLDLIANVLNLVILPNEILEK